MTVRPCLLAPRSPQAGEGSTGEQVGADAHHEEQPELTSYRQVGLQLDLLRAKARRALLDKGAS